MGYEENKTSDKMTAFLFVSFNIYLDMFLLSPNSIRIRLVLNKLKKKNIKRFN